MIFDAVSTLSKPITQEFLRSRGFVIDAMLEESFPGIILTAPSRTYIKGFRSHPEFQYYPDIHTLAIILRGKGEQKCDYINRVQNQYDLDAAIESLTNKYKQNHD